MAHTSPQTIAQLRQLIFYHLDNESVDDANFLAARLHALEPRNADSVHLLSLTFLRMRRFRTAYDTAHKYGYTGKNLGCAYVFALSCEHLGRYHEGIAALEKSKPLWSGRSHWNKHSEGVRKHLPDSAAVYNLLGKLWRGHGDLRRSGECFFEAHKANPFTWSAFQGMCDIGAEINATSAFKMTPEMKASASTTNQPTNGVKEDALPATQPAPVHAFDTVAALSTPTNDPFSNPKSGSDWSFQFPKIKAKGMFGSPPKVAAHPSWETPTANTDDDVEMGGISSDHHDVIPAAPARRSKTLSRLGFDSSRDSSRLQPPNMKSLSRTTSDTTDHDDAASTSSRNGTLLKRTATGQPSNAASDFDNAPPRRSNRLFGQIGSSKPASRIPADSASFMGAKRETELKKAKATGIKGRGTSTVGRVVSGNRKIMPPAPDTKDARAPSRNSVAIPPVPTTRTHVEPSSPPDSSSIESLLSLFRQLGIGYSALATYDCKSAIRAFDAVPPAQRETAWVLAQLGKAYHESTDYVKAEQCFARMLKIQPPRVEDTEVYSTVLWHLKKPVQLAFLAHTLKELDFEAPQTWCVVGNAFSLNREHDRAINCFRRATQIDPKFNYAWTLMGHELLTNEEFDNAISAYRKGLGSERRGYASWYGLGKCYERMGKYEEAERHYRIAASINKQHSVLVVAIGVVLERMRHPREALAQYTHAIALTPTSTLARFRRARALMTLRLYNEALVELKELAFLAPEEPNVWFMLGRCNKALGNRGDAVKCFTSSLNLDAKSQAFVKEALDNIDESDDGDESD